MTDLERAFEILGIEPTEDAKAVRTAWRALVRSYHPDTARTDPVGANKRLTEINVAYDAVSACTAEEIATVKAKAANREQMAERLRRERAAKEKETRDRQQAEQMKARQQARAAAQAKAERAQRQAKASARKAETLPVAKTPVKDNTDGNIDMSHLVARAERGFRDAVKACTLQTLMPTRSSYA